MRQKKPFTNEQKIVNACNLDGNSLASVYVVEALRVGLLTYIHEFSDEKIKNGWGFFDSPAGVRAKMQRILDEISKE